MIRIVLAAMAILLAVGAASGATMRKCKDSSTGKLFYTDNLCPKGSRQVPFEIRDNRVGALPPGTVKPLSTQSSAPQKPAATPKHKPPSTSGSTGSSVPSPVDRSHY